MTNSNSTLLESEEIEYRPGEPLIFLDIDGVLNRHHFDSIAGSNIIDQALVQIFNGILLVTGAKIILSSAWRYLYYRDELSIIGLDWLLRSHGMVAHRLIDVTPRDRMVTSYNGTTLKEWPVENERGSQIKHWLSLNDPNSSSPYIVIDDGGFREEQWTDEKQWTDLGIQTCGHRVIWTDPSTGLSHRDANRATLALTPPYTFCQVSSPVVSRRSFC